MIRSGQVHFRSGCTRRPALPIRGSPAPFLAWHPVDFQRRIDRRDRPGKNGSRISIRREQIQLASTFAGQAAVAVDNAKLFEESLSRAADLDQRSQRLALLNRFSSDLSGLTGCRSDPAPDCRRAAPGIECQSHLSRVV